MPTSTTLHDFILSDPGEQPMLWVACDRCGRALGRHDAWILDGFDPPCVVIGDFIGRRETPKRGEQLEPLSRHGPFSRVWGVPGTTRSDLRRSQHRGPRTGPGIYPSEFGGVIYAAKHCHCNPGTAELPKRRVDKLGALPVRVDADGRAWVDF